jgi:hypothetical protein
MSSHVMSCAHVISDNNNNNTTIQGELLHWKDCAEVLKKEMDEKEGGTWHCIVGTHFGSFVSHGMLPLLFSICSFNL